MDAPRILFHVFEARNRGFRVTGARRSAEAGNELFFQQTDQFVFGAVAHGYDRHPIGRISGLGELFDIGGGDPVEAFMGADYRFALVWRSPGQLFHERVLETALHGLPAESDFFMHDVPLAVHLRLIDDGTLRPVFQYVDSLLYRRRIVRRQAQLVLGFAVARISVHFRSERHADRFGEMHYVSGSVARCS